MGIYFKSANEEFYGINTIITPVVEVAKKYSLFVEIVCEILTAFDTYSEHIVNDVIKALKIYAYKLDKENEYMLNDYIILKNHLEQFYWNVVDDDFAKEIKIFNQNHYYNKGMRYRDKRLGRYRGLLFEELATAMVKDRFFGHSFMTGCQVYINGMRIIALYGEGDSYHKETIDIAGWVETKKYGEFYECKINPNRFCEENYCYFMKLIDSLQAYKTNKFIIGLISAEETKHLEILKKYIESKNKKCKAEFELLGRDKIYALLNYKIPEIA